MLFWKPTTRKDLTTYIGRFAATLDEPLGRVPETISKRLGKVSYAEAEEFCRDVRRRSILAMGEKPMATIVAERLTQWSARQRVSVSKELGNDGLSAAADAAPGA